MLLHNKILNAIEHAPVITDQRGVWDIGISHDDPNFVRAATEEEFGRLLLSLEEVMGTAEDCSARITRTIRHEGQHRKAALDVRAESGGFGIALFTRRDTGLLTCNAGHVVSYQREHSPLQRAAVSAYPIDPSEGDVLSVQNQGFTDLDDVARQALENNRAGMPFIPVPLSVRL